MPNIRRRFADDDDDDDQIADDAEPTYGSGKQLRVMGGGRGMGKQLRPVQQESDNGEQDSEESESEEEEEVIVPRGGGKGFRPSGGKFLRPQNDDGDEDDDDSDEEEDEELIDDDEPVRAVNRSGGKSLMRMREQEEEDDSDEDSDDSDEEEEQQPIRVANRSGGKSLSAMRPPSEDEKDESEEETKQVYQPQPRGGGKSLASMSSRGGGKQLRPMAQEDSEEEEVDEDSSSGDEEPVIQRSPAGGKQLHRPSPAEEEMAVKPKSSIMRSPAGGKQLRRAPASDEEEAPQPKTSISRSPAGGKQLRRPPTNGKDDEDSDEDDFGDDDSDEEMEDVEEVKPKPQKAVAASPGGGKMLRSPGGGKMLRAPEPEKEEVVEEEKPKKAEPKTKAKKAATPAKKDPPKKRGRPPKKKPVVTEPDDMEESEDEDEEVFGDKDEDSSDEEQLDMETFDTQRLVKDEADRKYLETLPEFEREAILGERFEKLKAEQDMKKALRESKRKKLEEQAPAKETKASKRKAEAKPKAPPKKKAKPAEKAAESADADTSKDAEIAAKLSGASARESARNRDATGAKSKKAAALAKLRDERKTLIESKKDESDESDLEFGDDDDDSDDDYEESNIVAKPWQQKKAAKSTISRLDQMKDSDESSVDDRLDTGREKVRERVDREAPPADLEDFVKVTIPRRRLGRWCNEPYFEQAVLGSFVRLFVGEDDTGEKCYRLCEIIAVNPAEKGPYHLPTNARKEIPISTDKNLRLRFAESEKDFPMSLISDAQPAEKEVSQYISALKDHRKDVLTKRQASKIVRVRDELINNYTYTTQDIEQSLAARKKTGKGLANLGSEQTKAQIAVQAAKDTLSDAKRALAEAKKSLASGGEDIDHRVLEENVDRTEAQVESAKKALQERLDELQAVKDAVRDRKGRLAQRSKDKNWAKVNQRNLTLNQRTDFEVSQKEKEAAEAKAKAVADGAKEKFNPFARRRVKPKILWKVGQVDDQEGQDATKGEEEKKDSREDPTDKKAGPGEPMLVQEDKVSGLNQSHQFTIDEEVLAQSSDLNGFSRLSSNRRAQKQRVRKGLSIAEYLDRKAKGTL